jgi:NADH-quinone oxidoreductase subunit L
MFLKIVGFHLAYLNSYIENKKIILNLLVILLPLLFIIFCTFINIKNLEFYSVIISFFTFLASIYNIKYFYIDINLNIICYEYNIKTINLFNWLNCNFINVKWNFLFDNLTISMCFIICIISFLVQLYSLDYMKHDPEKIKFFNYLTIFAFFMLIFVTSGNFIQMFLGWEGVGISSFLLISFWSNRIKATKSALKAIIMNRIGDVSLLICLSIIYYSFNSFDYFYVLNTCHFLINQKIIFFFYEIYLLDLISFFILIGVIAKSSQIGLHTWLPDAMEGPTPVSALIHAATMVTAGIFLLLRCSPIIEYSSIVLSLLIIIGSLTAIFGATTACFQNDIKKIVAFSTCSQLGYMVFSCGLSNYNGAFFHLSTHAFFKALLFLTCGSIIHYLLGEQDIRKMGNLINYFPITFCFFIIGNLALTGFPYLSGFFSKEFLIEYSYTNSFFILFNNFDYVFANNIAIMSAFFTTIYTVRSFYIIFFSTYNGYNGRKKYLIEHINLYNISSLFCLSIFSIFIGFFIYDLIIGFGNLFLLDSFFFLKLHNNLKYLEIFLDLLIKNYPIILNLIAFFLSFLILYILFFF